MNKVQCKIDHSPDTGMIPEFLCRTCHPEITERGRLNPPKVVHFIDAKIAADQELREQQKKTRYEQWRKKQTETDNIEELARRHLLPAESKEGLRWDTRSGKWIPDTLSQPPQEEDAMSRLVITPYGSEGQILARGKTSIKENATQEEIDAKVHHAFIRAGIRRTAKVEVAKDGVVIQTKAITFEDISSAEQQASAAAEEVTKQADATIETEEPNMAKKRKSVKAKKANGDARRTRATLTAEMLARKSGVTLEELKEAFKSEFGNGKLTTARIAITKIPKQLKKKTVKEKSETRGTIYRFA